MNQSQQTAAQPKLITVPINSFLRKKIPPPALVLEPFLPERGLAMIHAETGVGKTHVALNMAYAVATGSSFLNWKAPEPRGVLYIDGEMAEVDLQMRLNQIAKVNGGKPKATFKVCNIEQQVGRGMPDISSREGQREVWDLITDDIDLIVLDNLSTLSLGGKENESASWTCVQQWLLSMRANGKTVLLVHHSGKNGQQRGTSKRTDVLNTVIDLRRPRDYTPEQGAAFEIHFTKARGVHGSEVKPIMARLNQESGWEWEPVEESTHQQIVNLFNEGLNQTEIARELEMNKSTVNRHIKRAQNDGEIVRKENK